MTDLDGRAFKRLGNTLVGADFAADELLNSITEGKEVLITIRQPRSVEHHRWFFALLRKVVSNSDRWNDEQELLDVIKIASGLTKPVVLLDGTVYRRPRSISFASMPQDAFQRFVKRALYVLGQMTGVDSEALMAETNASQPPANKLPRKSREKHGTETDTAPQD